MHRGCLSSDCHNKILDTWWLQQRALLSHSSGGWKVYDWDAGWSGSCWGLPFWLMDGCLLTVSFHDGERERDSCLFTYKGTNPITRTLSSWPRPNLTTLKGSQTLTAHWGYSMGEICCRVSLSATPWTATHQAPLSCSVFQSLLKLMSIKSVMPSNHLIPCCPLLLLPSVFPSIRVFSNESTLCIRWPKYWRFSFNISPSNGYSGLISFRMDSFDVFAVHGTLKSLLQHHSPKASILQHLTFFMFQLSHPYMTTGNTIALTIWTFLGKVMSLPF